MTLVIKKCHLSLLFTKAHLFSAPCLPHITTKPYLKSLKSALTQFHKLGCFSAVFAHYSKSTEVFRSIKFPYGSPFSNPTDGLK